MTCVGPVWSTCCSDVMCVCVTGAVWCSWSSMTCVEYML